jgi:hypothetical protein
VLDAYEVVYWVLGDASVRGGVSFMLPREKASRLAICCLAKRWKVRVSMLIPINIKNDFSLINQIYFNIIGHMQIWLHQLDGTAQAVTL